jgi:DNA-binding winged helix-turn-helix (wHTH) protein
VCRDQPLELAPLEFQLLRLLVEQAGQVVSYEDIIDAVYSDDAGYGDKVSNNLDRLKKVYASLRAKLGEDGKRITAVPRQGLLFDPDCS